MNKPKHSLLMKLIFLSLGFILVSTIVFGQTANITIKVNGIEEAKGGMNVALYDNAKAFPGRDHYVYREVVPINSKMFKYTFTNVSPGTYAIAVYHDIDKNGILNKNWIGIPKEPYGVSNDAKGRMGPPDYEDASFVVKQDIEMEINLTNL